MKPAFALSTLLFASGAVLAGPPSLPNPVDETAFREIFLGSLSKTYPNGAREKLIYLPVEELTSAPKSALEAKTPLQFLESFYSPGLIPKYRPVELYQRGLKSPSSPWSAASVADALKATGAGIEDRVTLVVIPGIFGELIPHQPFGDVLATESSEFRSLWRNQLKAYKAAVAAGQADASALTDPSYDLHSRTYLDLPLDSPENDGGQVAFGSLDENKKSLANLIVFKTRLGSLETLGHLRTGQPSAENPAPRTGLTEIFLRRLTKVFRVLGTKAPKNIVLIGYSRGTVIALDMLSLASSQSGSYPWVKNVKGLVSLGGVNYGADFADDAINFRGLSPEPLEKRLVDALLKLRQGLQPRPDFKDPANPTEAEAQARLDRLAANGLAWGQFIFTMWQLRPELDKLNAQSAPPGTKPASAFSIADPMAAFRAAFQRLAGPSPIRELFTQQFRLDKPVGEYDENIRRFHILMDETADAILQLSTRERLAWWSSHSVPTQGVRYYSITGLMPDPKDQTAENKEIVGNPFAFNPKSEDDKSLASQYTMFKNKRGVALNDSQMALFKVRFWPELTSLFKNPVQLGLPPMQASYLGVMGTHHWGLALYAANAKKGESQLYNPFPRADLLKALAASVATDLASGHIK